MLNLVYGYEAFTHVNLILAPLLSTEKQKENFSSVNRSETLREGKKTSIEYIESNRSKSRDTMHGCLLEVEGPRFSILGELPS